MKLKSGLYSDYKDESREQTRLHEKYRVEDQEVKIVEKPMLGKFIVRTIGSIIRWSSQILLIVLASIGMIALLYPPCKAQLLIVYYDILAQIKLMLHL